MKRFFIFTFLIITSNLAFAGGGCSWNKAADAFAELRGNITFTFKDAVDCTPLAGVKIKFGEYKLRTGYNGKVTIPKRYFKDIMNASATLKAEKRGYIGFVTEIPIMVTTIWKTRFVMTKGLRHNQARFTLEWQKFPRDLDLHLIGRKNGNEILHISYRNMKNARNQANLDQDDVSSFGPETITLLDIKPGVEYTIRVHSYSGESFKGQERVKVYLNNELEEEITLPRTSRRWIDVLSFSKKHYRNLQNR